MTRIPDETIRAIRDRIDIVELVGRYVALRKAGRNYVGLCPFHSEKTPSFNVSPDRQSYHCFGCGTGGSAFGFLQQHDNLTFPEAVRALGRECGIEVRDAGGEKQAWVATSVEQANDVAQAFFRRCLRSPQAERARAYLTERGLDGETAGQLGIGYAPDSWEGLKRELAASRIPAEVGERAGLLRPGRSGSPYDVLRGRITFPIQDARGRILGFGGRALETREGVPKYLNSPESPIYRKREAFYGFPHALEAIRRRERAVIAEGYFDRIALHRAGVSESLATCGTALTAEHARNLRRRTREGEVVLLFDGDDAGWRAVLSALEVLLPEGLRVRAAALPQGEDPDSLFAKEGSERLRALVDDAPPAFELVAQRAAANGCATPWEKADAAGELARLVALVPHPVERQGLVVQTARATTIHPKAVEAAVRAARRGDLRGVEESVAPRPRRTGPEERYLRGLAQAVVDCPKAALQIDRDELAELVPESPARTVVMALLDAASGGEIDVPGLGDRLEDEARTLLFEVANAGERLDERGAQRAVRETLVTMRKLRQRQKLAVLRQRIQERDGDYRQLLDEMQKEKRAGTTAPYGRPQLASPDPGR